MLPYTDVKTAVGYAQRFVATYGLIADHFHRDAIGYP
jgi:hypothetical protein